MYILVNDAIPVGIAINSVAHAVLLASDKWRGDELFESWKTLSFKKVTVASSLEQMQKAKDKGASHVSFFEEDIGGVECAVVFFPSEKHHRFFRNLELYGNSTINESTLGVR